MTYPATRRFFRDDEFRNDSAAIAGLARSLALWENYTWARDLVITPTDSKLYGEPQWPWAPGGSFEFSAVRTLSGAFGTRRLANILVPDPRSPHCWVKVAVNISLPALTAVSGSVSVTNQRTGDVATAAIGPTATNFWVELSIQAEVDDILTLDGTWVSGQTITVLGYSAWFWSLSAPGCKFDTPWANSGANAGAIKPTSLTSAGSPLASFMLRWLGRAANSFVNWKPQVVAAAWFGSPAAGTGAGYSTMSLVVGRYKLSVAPTTREVVVQLRYRASGACSVTCALSTGESASANIAGAGSGTVSATITISQPASGQTQYPELTLTVAGSPTYCDVQHVLVYEMTSDYLGIGAPGGYSVTPTYDANLDARLVAGRAIRQDDILRLVDNMLRLWMTRRCRVLVNDCRYSYKELETWSFTGIQGLTDTAQLHAIPLVNQGGDAIYQVRVRSGWHLQPDSIGQEMTLQVGEEGTSDYLGSPAYGATFGVGSVSQASWQHKWGTTPSTPGVKYFATRLIMPGDNRMKTTRPSWMVLEQLPLATPALTYP